jgi:hypothetical protein
MEDTCEYIDSAVAESRNGEILQFGVFFKSHLFAICTSTIGARGSVVVKALFYKPEGRGFDSR